MHRECVGSGVELSESRISKTTASSISYPPPTFHRGLLSLIVCFHSHAVETLGGLFRETPSHWSIPNILTILIKANQRSSKNLILPI